MGIGGDLTEEEVDYIEKRILNPLLEKFMAGIQRLFDEIKNKQASCEKDCQYKFEKFDERIKKLEGRGAWVRSIITWSIGVIAFAWAFWEKIIAFFGSKP